MTTLKLYNHDLETIMQHWPGYADWNNTKWINQSAKFARFLQWFHEETNGLHLIVKNPYNALSHCEVTLPDEVQLVAFKLKWL